MMSCTYGCLRNVINLGNSIIGVSILAMPYCFQKCGILLSLLLIVLSGILVRMACYLLLKGAVMARRRNFEYLAFHAMGPTGKLAVEIGVIGFLIGVCIAFFVVIGDLGPPLASEYFLIENTSNLRAEVLIFLGVFVALPLGLLRKVDSLTSLSFLSIGFYICLVLKIFSEAASKLAAKDWWYEVNWWKSEGFLPCLPIFSMALSCQTQLFEFFDTLSEPSLKRMTSVVSGAVYLCSTVYISVGLFGYIACHDKPITGNILVNMTPSVMTEFIKLGFIVTVVISFPLCLFPCRTSLHSLLFKQGLGHHDLAVNFIPDHRFRVLTISLVIITVGISIMLPNIEFVLSIVGSTIGSTICFIFPAVIFIHDMNKNTSEKRLAQVVLLVGMFILLACTYSTLRESKDSPHKPNPSKEAIVLPHPLVMQHFSSGLAVTVPAIPITSNKGIVGNIANEKLPINVDKINNKEINGLKNGNEKRHEPPEPREPDVKAEKIEQSADIDPQALQKEDKEIQKESLGNGVTPAKISDTSLKDKQELLLRQLEKQQKEQKIILEQQKQVLEELKMHKEIHEEAIREKVIKQSEQEKQIMPLQENISKIPDKSLLSEKNVIKPNKNSVENFNQVKNSQHEIMQNMPPSFSEKSIPLNYQNAKNEHFVHAKPNAVPDVIPLNMKSQTLQKSEIKLEGNPKELNFKPPIQQKEVLNNMQNLNVIKNNISVIQEKQQLSDLTRNSQNKIPNIEQSEKVNLNNHDPSLDQVKLNKNLQNVEPEKKIPELNAYKSPDVHQTKSNQTDISNQHIGLIDNGKREMR